MIYCLFLLWNGSITYGTMTLFLQQRSALSGAFGTLVGLIPSFLNSSVSAHRVRELVDLPREVRLSTAGPDVHEPGGFTVEMQDVTFAYREGDSVIRDSAFRAAPGEIVALVGPSGEGKTTLVRLILGMMQPGEGSVVIKAGGRITQMNASLRHLMTYVPQGNTILTGTIAENLRSVREDATDEEVIEALKTACAWDFVSKLPEGINSGVGERGRGLSEGQAQRIAIARAILRDAPVILMDEATSALDVATERRVLSNIMTGDPTRTVILTTHRPTVLTMCTRVYKVMDTSVRELTREEAAELAIDF
jgi:ABC-type bacteriocin/lantibiotic exporter with double-glycine peptidase domain